MSRPRPMLALMEGTLVGLARFHAWLGRTPALTPAHQLGLDGERAAYFYVRRAGFTVVARRWRHATLKGEVDLIAWEGDTLAFIEVKTRDTRTAFAAEFRVDKEKMAALRRMADAYVRQLPWRTGQDHDVAIRFDVASVYLQQGGRADIQLMRDFMR